MFTDLIFRDFQLRQLSLITIWMAIWICTFLTIRCILQIVMAMSPFDMNMICLQVTGYTETIWLTVK